MNTNTLRIQAAESQSRQSEDGNAPESKTKLSFVDFLFLMPKDDRTYEKTEVCPREINDEDLGKTGSAPPR